MRAWRAGQMSAFNRNIDTMARNAMPAISLADPLPTFQAAPRRLKVAAMTAVAVVATTRNETGRVWSF